MGGMFKDILGSSESLFRDDVALDYSYQPKLIPYREKEQMYIVSCIKPLFQGRNGKNVFVHGQPGIGKTAACLHIKKEIEEETDDIVPIYINCWQKNTTHKIILDICEILDYKFVQNRRTEELFAVIRQLLNRKAAVFIFDEADRLEDIDLLYMIIEEIYKKSIVLITNRKGWLADLDERVKSRLTAEMLEFRPYSLAETRGILKQRMEYAFVPGVWDEEALELVSKKAFDAQDMRTGLYLLREAANMAEGKSSRKITVQHAQEALSKLGEFTSKGNDTLAADEQAILDLVKNSSGSKIGSLFELYQKQGGNLAYGSFRRRVDRLERDRFVCLEKTEGGAEGNTTIVKFNDAVKKLTEF
ncbi:AAA family ATPase [Candidatus Woesearchaeota archaeon]|nr:AAA family ATPase [Candidatus Woesearchaeota archaeon]